MARRLKQSPLQLRRKVLKALRELKSTHTFKEISEKTGVRISNLKRIYYLHCEKIPFSPEAKARIYGVSNERKLEIKDELFDMRNQGATFKEIGERFNFSSVSAYAIYYWLLKKQKQIEIEEMEEMEEMEEEVVDWLDEKLVLKYALERRFDLSPAFIISTYKVTHRTAQSICNRLKRLGESCE